MQSARFRIRAERSAATNPPALSSCENNDLGDESRLRRQSVRATKHSMILLTIVCYVDEPVDVRSRAGELTMDVLMTSCK
jgi:hypothetical protein